MCQYFIKKVKNAVKIQEINYLYPRKKHNIYMNINIVNGREVCGYLQLLLAMI